MHYKNGSLQAEIPFKNDNINGDIRFYTEDKKLFATINAQNDKFINGKCHNDKVLTDNELRESSKIIYDTDLINYLKEICLKSDSK